MSITDATGQPTQGPGANGQNYRTMVSSDRCSSSKGLTHSQPNYYVVQARRRTYGHAGQQPGTLMGEQEGVNALQTRSQQDDGDDTDDLHGRDGQQDPAEAQVRVHRLNEESG